MRKSRFTESQIVDILKQGEAGVPIAEILRQHNISKATYFQWRAKYAGASVDELKRLKELETENTAETHVRRARAGERGDQGRLEPKAMTPSAKREAQARRARTVYFRSVYLMGKLTGQRVGIPPEPLGLDDHATSDLPGRARHQTHQARDLDSLGGFRW
jgi:putative transposase